MSPAASLSRGVLIASVVGLSLLAVLVLWSQPAPEAVVVCPPDNQGPVIASPTPTRTATDSPPPTEQPPTTTSPTPEPTPAPTSEPTPRAQLAALQQRMAAAVERYPVPGRYAVAVTDLETGETVNVNGDRAQLSGCSINFFVLLQVTLDVQEGRYPLAAVDALVRETTWSSNAATALELYRIVGGGDALAGVARVDTLIRERLRLPNTELNHPPAFAAQFNLRSADNWMSANDANDALAQLWRGDGLTPESRSYLLDRLATVEPGLNYLTGSVANAVVHHKNGFFWYPGGYVDNDIGIVRLKDTDRQRVFAISVLSEEVRTRYADVRLARELIQLAVEHFSDAGAP